MSLHKQDSAGAVILARVREALQLPAPPPHLRSQAAEPARPGALPILPAEAGRPWLPDGGETPEEQRRILADNLARLRAEFIHVADTAAAAAFIAARGATVAVRLAVHADPLVAAATATVGCETHAVDAGTFDKQALEACDAGVTACESLVAQTGSVLVSSDSCGGRSLSVLPHVHLVVATAGQVVGTLADAFARARERYGGRMPSMLSFITGPSRTGDIERILVLGAHGPRELVVILVG